MSQDDGTTQKQEVTREMLDFCDKTLAKIGRSYTFEFIADLAGRADEATTDWLKEHKRRPRK